MRTPEGWGPNGEAMPFRGTPAGGGYSTVGDLDLFAKALMGHRLLDAEHTDLITTGKVEADGEMRYAYGFMDAGEWTVVGFEDVVTGAAGMAALFWIYPEAQWLVAVVSNRDPPAAKFVTDAIVQRLHEATAG